jgi:RNA polymerase sigma factor (sigma-70 family)
MIDKNNYYIGNVQLPNIISMEEQVALLKDYHYNNNKEAKNKLITHNTRAVSNMVNKYFGITDLDDLFSIGVEGLIHAVDKFDVRKYDNGANGENRMGKSWVSFMITCIDNQIKMYLRKFNRLNKNEDVILDKNMVGKDNIDGRETLGALIIDDKIDYNPEDKLERKEILKKIKELFETVLEDDEKKILLAHCGFVTGKKMTEIEIKEYYGFSYCRSYINRKKTKALKKLRKKLIHYK